MKSTEFITDEDEMAEKYAGLILEDCQAYLRQNNPKNAPMYRGIKATTMDRRENTFLKKRVRLDDRTPKDTSTDLHGILNDYFNERYGAPFRNAMFCTGDFNFARNYGQVFHIFPRGNFEFLWSKDVDDLYSMRDEYFGMVGAQEEFLTALKNTQYYTTDLPNALKYNNEIMMRCNSYYALNDDNEAVVSKVLNLL